MRGMRWLVVVVVLAGTAHAGPIEGRIGLGVRASSTNVPPYDTLADDSPSARPAADVLVGVRAGDVVIGLHAGIATRLRFYASQPYDSGETVPYATSTILPLDLGIGAQVDLAPNVWASAWAGATVGFMNATSPAMHVNSIAYTGDIPSAAWSDRSTGLGLGAAVGYDVLRTDQGRVGVVVAFDWQSVGHIANRGSRGEIESEQQTTTCRSLSLGLSYAY